MERSSPARILPVAVPGSRGAYSQKAARRFFGEHRPALTCGTARAAVAAIAEGRASHAVVPVENSITGVFDGIAEAFFEGEVSVVGEILLPTRHCLLAAPGTRLEDVSVVTAHPHSLAQCRDWLTSWGLATRPTEDTPRAGRELLESKDGALAVIGDRELAALHGLDVLAEGISDRPDNRTRFLVLGGPDAASETGSRHAARVGPVGAPRLRKTLRIQLESLGASRVRVPFLGAADGRRFLVEFDLRERSGREVAERACNGVEHRFLGSWDPGR